MKNFEKSDPFIHLRLHSSYSLLQGAIRPEELPKLWQKNLMPAVGVTDTGNLFGAAVSEIEDEDGYSITKTDDDFYTFTVSTAPGITGNGGGGFASAGPATLSN